MATVFFCVYKGRSVSQTADGCRSEPRLVHLASSSCSERSSQSYCGNSAPSCFLLFRVPSVHHVPLTMPVTLSNWNIFVTPPKLSSRPTTPLCLLLHGSRCFEFPIRWQVCIVHEIPSLKFMAVFCTSLSSEVVSYEIGRQSTTPPESPSARILC